MALTKFELVNHPVRLRILESLGQGDKTPRQLAAALPDVSQATLYRHVSTLSKGGIITVSGTRQAHGTVESTYSYVPESAHFSRDEFGAMSADEHKSLHAVMAGSAAAALARYVEQEAFDPQKDGMTYFSTGLTLTDGEATRFKEELFALLESYSALSSESGRSRLLNVSFIPGER